MPRPSVTTSDPGLERDTCHVLGEDPDASAGASYAGAWLGLLQAHRQLTRELESRLEARFGLSLSALELLGRLAASHDRQLRLSALAGATGLTPSRISRIVDGLEGRRLVERRTCLEDGRGTFARLTNRGLVLSREAQAAHTADVHRVFLDRLSTDELAVLASAFAGLVEAGSASTEPMLGR